MKNSLLGAIALLSLGGCSSEVDKCVAEWEKANPGPDNQGDFCAPSERDYNTRKCSPNASTTKAQARAQIRMNCLAVSKGR
jgi:hypothetical protein